MLGSIRREKNAMSKLIIRDAVSDDIKPLAQLHVESWKVAYAPILTQAHLDWVSVQREVRRNRKLIKEGSPYLVVERDERPVGFMVYSASDLAADAVEIDSFWVHHEATRQGIGSALLAELRQRESPKRIYVWVLTGVKAGPRFYEKHGFRPEEETRTDFVFLDEPMPMIRYRKNCRYRRPSTGSQG